MPSELGCGRALVRSRDTPPPPPPHRPPPASKTQVRHDRAPFTISINSLHNPAAMKKGALDTALKTANNAVGSHHHALPVRIILSAKNRYQIVSTRNTSPV